MFDTDFQHKARRKPVAEINVVPYIDVMLVLLVIFMVTAPLLQQGVEVSLPEAKAKPLPKKAKVPMVVTVDKQGHYFLNIADDPKTAMDESTLQVRVAAELMRDPKRLTLVRGDKQASYDAVLGAMVVLQQAGVDQVGLETDFKE